MAFTPYHNIDGSDGLDVELIKQGSNVQCIKSISIANTHATADATVSLFIQNDPTAASASTFRIISTVAIPSDVTLTLDNDTIPNFNNSSNGYGLYLTVGSSDTLDVIINV